MDNLEVFTASRAALFNLTMLQHQVKVRSWDIQGCSPWCFSWEGQAGAQVGMSSDVLWVAS